MNRKRFAALVAAGIGVALVLTACSAISNGRQIVSGPNGLAVQSQTRAQNFTPVGNKHLAAPAQMKPSDERTIPMPQTNVEEQAVEKTSKAEGATSAEAAKSVEQTQTQTTQQVPAQMTHHCHGYSD
jgi:hypothetical protein